MIENFTSNRSEPELIEFLKIRFEIIIVNLLLIFENWKIFNDFSKVLFKKWSSSNIVKKYQA